MTNSVGLGIGGGRVQRGTQEVGISEHKHKYLWGKSWQHLWGSTVAFGFLVGEIC